MSWVAPFAVIFGPAGFVFLVYLAAKHGFDTKREPCVPIHDVRPYDARKLDWRNR